MLALNSSFETSELAVGVADAIEIVVLVRGVVVDSAAAAVALAVVSAAVDDAGCVGAGKTAVAACDVRMVVVVADGQLFVAVVAVDVDVDEFVAAAAVCAALEVAAAGSVAAVLLVFV